MGTITRPLAEEAKGREGEGDTCPYGGLGSFPSLKARPVLVELPKGSRECRLAGTASIGFRSIAREREPRISQELGRGGCAEDKSMQARADQPAGGTSTEKSPANG